MSCITDSASVNCKMIWGKLSILGIVKLVCFKMRSPFGVRELVSLEMGQVLEVAGFR